MFSDVAVQDRMSVALTTDNSAGPAPRRDDVDELSDDARSAGAFLGRTIPPPIPEPISSCSANTPWRLRFGSDRSASSAGRSSAG